MTGTKYVIMEVKKPTRGLDFTYSAATQFAGQLSLQE